MPRPWDFQLIGILCATITPTHRGAFWLRQSWKRGDWRLTFRAKLSAVDRRALACSFALCFCVGIHYVAKPARDAYMLQYWGTANLPWLNGGLLIVVVLAARLHERIVQQLGVLVVFPIIGLFTSFVYCVTPALIPSHPHIASAVLSVTVGVFNLTGLAAVWSLVDSAFDKQEARRVFAFATLGGPVGSVLGAFLASRLAVRGPEALLTTAACLILIAVTLTIGLVRHIRSDTQERLKFTLDQKMDESKLRSLGWRLAFAFQYPRVLLALAVTISGMGAVVKWVFFRIGELHYVTVQGRTSYFATSYLSIAILSLLAQLFIAPIVLRRLGPGRGLQLLPVLTVCGVLLIGYLRTSVAVSWCTLIFMALDYTVNQCSRELLYLPTPLEIRFNLKQYVDTAGRQSGVMIGNGIVLALLVANAPVLALSVVIVVLSVGWFGLATRARSAYRRLTMQ